MRFAIVAIFVALCVAQIWAAPQVGGGPVAGGLNPITDFGTVRPTLEKLLADAAKKHNLRWTLIEILNAQGQVIAGYRTIGDAHFDVNGEKTKCKYEFIERAWEEYSKGTFSCHPDFETKYTIEHGPVART